MGGRGRRASASAALRSSRLPCKAASRNRSFGVAGGRCEVSITTLPCPTVAAAASVRQQRQKLKPEIGAMREARPLARFYRGNFPTAGSERSWVKKQVPTYLPPPCLSPMWGHFTPTLEHVRNPVG